MQLKVDGNSVFLINDFFVAPDNITTVKNNSLKHSLQVIENKFRTGSAFSSATKSSFKQSKLWLPLYLHELNISPDLYDHTVRNFIPDGGEISVSANDVPTIALKLSKPAIRMLNQEKLSNEKNFFDEELSSGEFSTELLMQLPKAFSSVDDNLSKINGFPVVKVNIESVYAYFFTTGIVLLVTKLSFSPKAPAKSISVASFTESLYRVYREKVNKERPFGFLNEHTFEIPTVIESEKPLDYYLTTFGDLKCTKQHQYLSSFSSLKPHSVNLSLNVLPHKNASYLKVSIFSELDIPSITELVSSLLIGIGDVVDGVANERAFTLTTAEISCADLSQSSLSEVDSLGYRLAHKYNDKYDVRDEIINNCAKGAMRDIRHFYSQSGGAIITLKEKGELNKQGQFFKSFIPRSIGRSYFIICLLAVHEHYFLIKSINTNAFKIPNVDEQSDLKLMAKITASLSQKHSEILNFRLNYRYSVASHLPIHNKALNQWRQHLFLDSLLDEATTDVSEINEFLERQHSVLQERQEKRWEVFGVIFAIIVFFTGFFGMNFGSITGQKGDQGFADMVLLSLDWHAYSLAALVLIGVFYAFLRFGRNKRKYNKK